MLDWNPASACGKGDKATHNELTFFSRDLREIFRAGKRDQVMVF